MKHIGIVYYSRSGTARLVAQRLADHLACSAHEVRDARPRIGVTGDLRCLFDSVFRRSAALLYDGPSPKAFDHVVIVTPVWLGALSSPIRAFLTRYAQCCRSYSLVVVMSRQGAERVSREASKIVRRRPIFLLPLKQINVLAEDFDADLRDLSRAIEAMKDDGTRLTTPV